VTSKAVSRQAEADLRVPFDAATRPLAALGLLAAVQVVVWTVLPALASTSPPLDVVEGLLWGQEWQLGYHKHPPLPPILVNIARDLTGSPIWGPYLLSQITVVLTFFLVYRTGRLVTTARNALVGTVLLSGVYYFTWPTPEFNHNVAQLPIWAGVIYLFARIRAKPEDGLRWIPLGLLIGVGIYAKYSVGVLYLTIVAWTLIEPRLRRTVRTPWPWFGAVVSLAVATPHLIWLVQSDFAPIRYASDRSAEAGSTTTPIGFLVAQALNHAPLLVVFGLIGYRQVARLPEIAWPRSDRAFVAGMALGPLAVTLLLSVVIDMDLRDMWGMPMFTMSGLFIVMVLRRDWSAPLVNRAYYVAVGVIVVVAVGYAASVPIRLYSGDRPRVGWPMAEMARLADDAWSRSTDAPLEIVSGPMWIAGLISAGAPSRPHVVYDGSLELSPWMTPAEMEEKGVLYVWEDKGKVPAAAAGAVSRGRFFIEGANAGDVVINYAVRAPGQK